MSKSMAEQLSEIVASGKLKLKAKEQTSVSPIACKKAIYVPKQLTDIVLDLAHIGRNEKPQHIDTFIPSTSNIISFLERIEKMRNKGSLSEIEEFFTLAAFVRINKHKVTRNEKFLNTITLSAARIYRLKALEDKINEKDFLVFQRIFFDVQKFIDSSEFDQRILSELDIILKSGDFTNADRVYNYYKEVVPVKISSFVEMDKNYQLLKDSGLKNRLKNEVAILLEQRDYDKADILANSSSLLSEKEYYSLKFEFVKKHIISISKTPLTEEAARIITTLIVQNVPNLSAELSLERIIDVVLSNLSTLDFPYSIYEMLLEDLANGIKRRTSSDDIDNVFILLSKILGRLAIKENDQHNIWTILCACPKLIKRISMLSNDLLDKIAGAYPYDQLLKIGDYYIPREISCLHYLIGCHLSFEPELYEQHKTIFQKNRYINCEMVIALLKAKHDGIKIELNDILKNLLLEIVHRTFEYKLKHKENVENLIFPKCISESGRQCFSIKEPKMIFCEGIRTERKDETIYMWCRNNMCKEGTDLIDNEGGQKFISYFFEILSREYHISVDQIFKNKNFSLAMGSFNRWNEIAERLFCGYPGEEGCGSSLIYSAIKGKPGWQAYATTFWHCSNENCSKHHELIKLSHCRGCGKIIDSRIDSKPCNRIDGKEYYICIRCGYCCSEHEVSWHCPKCKNEYWQSMDDYGKRYRCKKCSHEIEIPLGIKPQMIEKYNQTKGSFSKPIQNFNRI